MNANSKKGITKKGVLRFLLVIAVVLIAIVLRVFVRVGYKSSYEALEGAVSAKDWMKELSDDIGINQINMPGSHDCATNYVDFPLIAQCQNLSIAEQLDMGVRFLDVRLAMGEEENELYLVHSFAKCHTKGGLFQDKYYFDQLLQSCYDFLEAHPSETIVMNTKQDTGDPDTVRLQKAIASYIDSNPSKWYTTNALPTLGEVRGKIVLCRRYDNEAFAGNDKCGLDLSWTDMKGAYDDNYGLSYHIEELSWGGTLYVQDFFEFDTKHKYETILLATDNFNRLSEIPDGAILLNFLSTKGTDSAFGLPYKSATKINALYLKEDLDQTQQQGWVIMDFCEEEIVRKVFETNF